MFPFVSNVFLSAPLPPQDSCVRQAVRCVKMAKLVTLQLHLLNHGNSQRVINLHPSQLLNAILELPHCYQVTWTHSLFPFRSYPKSRNFLHDSLHLFPFVFFFFF